MRIFAHKVEGWHLGIIGSVIMVIGAIAGHPIAFLGFALFAFPLLFRLRTTEDE